jgi:hypothetical protein
LHALSFAEWLERPTIPTEEEVPHLVAAVLDSARFHFGSRVFSREIFARSFGESPLTTNYIVQYIGDELKDPKALKLR